MSEQTQTETKHHLWRLGVSLTLVVLIIWWNKQGFFGLFVLGFFFVLLVTCVCICVSKQEVTEIFAAMVWGFSQGQWGKGVTRSDQDPKPITFQLTTASKKLTKSTESSHINKDGRHISISFHCMKEKPKYAGYKRCHGGVIWDLHSSKLTAESQYWIPTHSQAGLRCWRDDSPWFYSID